MRREQLKNFWNGWIIGDFLPSIARTTEVEVSIMRHKKDAVIPLHFHAQAIEYNVLITGSMIVNGETLGPDDIFTFEKCEVSECVVLEDTTLVVVKLPSVRGDKHNV
jgi:hypothetical protein